jgi:enterochelin esterase family protein
MSEPRFSPRSSAHEPPAALRWTARCPDIPEGWLQPGLYQDTRSGRRRTFHAYRSPGLYTAQDLALLVLCDGAGYLRAGATHVLDNLVAARRIPPLLCLLLGHEDRGAELACSEDFVEELAHGLLPLVRREFRIPANRARTVMGGRGHGGLTAAFAGLRHPEIFGGVLSQSGAFGWAPEGAKEPEWLTGQFERAPRGGARFYLSAGTREHGLLDANRRLREVLEARGYEVAWRELNGGQGSLGRPVGLADGLLTLLGRQV